MMDEEGLQKIESIVRCDYYIKRKKRFCSNRATGNKCFIVYLTSKIDQSTTKGFSSTIDDSGENIIVRRCSMHTETGILFLNSIILLNVYLKIENSCCPCSLAGC